MASTKKSTNKTGQKAHRKDTKAKSDEVTVRVVWCFYFC